MSGLPDLLSLSLANNCITSLSPISKRKDDPPADNPEVKWRSLVFLDLSNNKITEVDDPKFPKLKELNLNNNEIRRVDNLEGLEALEVLFLGGNQLVDASKIRGLRSLRNLQLVK